MHKAQSLHYLHTNSKLQYCVIDNSFVKLGIGPIAADVQPGQSERWFQRK